MRLTRYIGILLGAIYGIALRILGGIDAVGDFYSIYSITFIWITPMIVSLIPIFISSNGLYRSKTKLFFYPVSAVLLFGTIALSTGLEDMLCILILGFPFIAVAGVTGICIGTIIKNNKVDKKLYSIVFLPFLLNPIESILPNTANTFKVESKIVVQKSSQYIWSRILEVPEIEEHEYNYGFYNFIGIPRPVKSELKKINNEIYRIGYFSDDLKLIESISEIHENKFVNFKVHIDRSQLRNKPTDQHLLRSNYFKFENVSYALVPIDAWNTQLILTCEYKINSKMNSYANFWASRIIRDFETRLLAALKTKLEK